MNRIILASASPRRADLLGQLGVPFIVVPSRAEELHDDTLDVIELCKLNAERKAADIAALHPAEIVLGADTLVTLNGRLYGKPADLSEAARMLAELSGHTHQVITAVCVMLFEKDKRRTFAVRTDVTFKRLAAAEIQAYLAAVPVLDKAGAYGIQDRGEMLVEKIAGSFTNVVGLPLEQLSEELRRWAVPIAGKSIAGEPGKNAGSAR